MPRVKEGEFSYVFPEDWLVQKWDDTAFHLNQFQHFAAGSKAVEFVAFNPQDEKLWLIECKDFRPNGRTKTIELCDEIAQKVRDSLAALICARNADDVELRRFARMALKKTELRCIVHWEHPLKPHRLWPSSMMDRKNMRDKLRQRMAVVDSLADIGNLSQLNRTQPWTISKDEE